MLMKLFFKPEDCCDPANFWVVTGTVLGLCKGIGGAGLKGAEFIEADGTGGAGRGGRAGFWISTFAGSRGSKLFDSAIAANLSNIIAVVRRWDVGTCKHPFIMS